MRTRERKPVDLEARKSGSLDEACTRYGLGQATMRRMAEDAGAVIRIGRRYLVNFTLMDSYLDSLSGV
jgi:hypothetical protein